MRAREGAKHLRWVTKERKKRAVRPSSLCLSCGGEVCMVHQNHEDEKNSSEFF
jgi:hypothetical protein